MSHPLTREEAARVLQLPLTAPTGEVKQAYRRLAREHHPDRGGDPDRFQHLQRAYERLADPDTPRTPPVARGRPSTPPTAFDAQPDRVDLGGVDWELDLPAGDLRLDRERLAVWLASDTDRLIHPIEATSRAPRSKLNRVAHVLAAELTSTVRIAEVTDDRRLPVVAVDVAGATRRARRALDTVDLDGGWVRTRRSTTTQLRSTLLPSHDRRATALRAVDRLEPLLELLGWPLASWTVASDRRRPH
jgi:hypothetical protein